MSVILNEVTNGYVKGKTLAFAFRVVLVCDMFLGNG
jgi:hypothetical protein